MELRAAQRYFTLSLWLRTVGKEEGLFTCRAKHVFAFKFKHYQSILWDATQQQRRHAHKTAQHHIWIRLSA